MYAAAGGASIANRRKQKRLQLAKQQKNIPINRSKLTGLSNNNSQNVNKYSRSQLPTSTLPLPTLQLPQLSQSSIYHQFHHQHQHPTIQTFHTTHDHLNQHSRRRRQDKVLPYRLAPPVSPNQFPISPPPLSLESPNSATLPLKSNNFPFPPPSILDLRSPSTSELQAALLIRRDKRRLRGKNVNFRELPSNLATRLIPPLPRYPPRSYAYGCGGQGPGKAAWQTRPSPILLSPASPHGSQRDGVYKSRQCEAHRRWMKRNRIRDASYCYGSSGEDDDEEGSYSRRPRPEMNAAVNTVLYAGLGTTALGLLISFVGTGEKGFLSPELKLVGPTLLCAGLLCCFLRVLLCICLCRCCGNCQWKPCRVIIVDKNQMKRLDKLNTSSSPASAHQLQQQLQPTACLLPQTSDSNNQIINKSNKTIDKKLTSTTTIIKPATTSTNIPSCHSSSSSRPTKGHEILLSPAQLPE